MITTSFLSISGTTLQGVNPLPLFRERRKHKSPGNNGSLLPEDLEYLGYECGFRILPYTMQDRYNRKRKTMQIKNIILENEFLRAEFLPSLGGRLYSLRDKKTKQELLFKNEVLQPANLAIRNAWFSGGIEWNIAQLGHTFTTFDSVFFAKVEAPDGYEFLRMYDYERTRGLIYQIDFHLPEASRQLYAHVTIVNDHQHPVPMYWWTNIAVPEEDGCRVFSATKDVLYTEPGSMSDGSDYTFGRGQLPFIDALPGADASYPLNSSYSNEYFFQNSKDEASPWEAITYLNGMAFFERSTQPLRTRKMFCWGSHEGGRNWCDFLSRPGKGNYVELQAGLTPTQLHGMDMEANSQISFTQAFGSIQLEPGDANNESYDVSQAIVRAIVNNELPAAEIQKKDAYFASLALLPCSKLLHTGQGWGALENLRRIKENEPLLPAQLSFPAESLTEEQYHWLALLNGEELPELKGDALPPSWMTDLKYLPYLYDYLETHPNSIIARIFAGTMLYEDGQYEEAINLWKEGDAINPHPLLLRNLAHAANVDGFTHEALTYMERIPWASYPNIDQAYLSEYFTCLLQDNQYQKLFDMYQHLPKFQKDAEPLLIRACEAAIELKEYKFLDKAFSREYAQLREGDNRMTNLWFRYAEEQGIDFSQLPKAIDFRIAQS